MVSSRNCTRVLASLAIVGTSFSPGIALAAPSEYPGHHHHHHHEPGIKKPKKVRLFAPVGSIEDIVNRAGDIGKIIGWTGQQTMRNSVPPALDEYIRDLPPPGYQQPAGGNPYNVSRKESAAILERAVGYCLMNGIPDGALHATDEDMRNNRLNQSSNKEVHKFVDTVFPGLTTSAQWRLFGLMKTSIISHCVAAINKKMPSHGSH